MFKKLLKKQDEEDLLPPPPPIEPLEAEKEEGEMDDILKGLEDSSEKPSGIMESASVKPFEPENSSYNEFKPLEIKEAEQEIRDAVQQLKKKPSFWQRLLARLSNKKSAPVQPSHEIEIKPEMDGVKAIRSLVREGRDALLSLDFDKARDRYVQANRIYLELSAERQSEVYEDLKSLYDERKSAEEVHLK